MRIRCYDSMSTLYDATLDIHASKTHRLANHNNILFLHVSLSSLKALVPWTLTLAFAIPNTAKHNANRKCLRHCRPRHTPVLIVLGTCPQCYRRKLSSRACKSSSSLPLPPIASATRPSGTAFFCKPDGVSPIYKVELAFAASKYALRPDILHPSSLAGRALRQNSNIRKAPTA